MRICIWVMQNCGSVGPSANQMSQDACIPQAAFHAIPPKSSQFNLLPNESTWVLPRSCPKPALILPKSCSNTARILPKFSVIQLKSCLPGFFALVHRMFALDGFVFISSAHMFINIILDGFVFIFSALYVWISVHISLSCSSNVRIRWLCVYTHCPMFILDGFVFESQYTSP